MKKYMKPVMVIVKIKTRYNMLGFSGLGKDYNPNDDTYSRRFSFDDEEDE